MKGEKTLINPRFSICNCLDSSFEQNIAKDVFLGLTSPRKYIPSKYFYDAPGSRLFDEICALPEYYLTRTEISILEEVGGRILDSYPCIDLVEMGSGSCRKISCLIESSHRHQGSGIRYIPVDVSESALLAAGEEITSFFKEIRVLGFVADFTRHLRHLPDKRQKIIILLGSTIGNFPVPEMRRLFDMIAFSMHSDDRFLLGLDMVKDSAIIEAAYNDPQGVTASFNKNILHVVNRELSGDFQPEAFDHLAFFNPDLEQIEMHLVARHSMTVTLGTIPLTVKLEKGESICTEISRKFRRDTIEDMTAKAGLAVHSWFTDSRGWFSLVELVKD